jgi:hypothetical protein
MAAAVTCVASLAAMAQGELVFVKQPVAQQSGYLQGIASAPDGGTYSLEWTASQSVTLLSKRGRDGSLEWNLTVQNAALHAIDSDNAGFISASGESSGDAVVIRFAPDGTEIWRTLLPSISESSDSLDATDSGEVFVGWKEQPTSCTPTNISRISAQGALIWTRAVNCGWPLRIGGTAAGDAFYVAGDTVGRITTNGLSAWYFNCNNLAISVLDVCIDPLGSAVYSGVAFQGSLFGSQVGGSDAIIFRVLPGGAINWVRRFGSPYDDDARRVVTDGSSFVVSGRTFGRFGGPTTGTPDVWICSIDALGTMAWSNQIGSSSYDDVQGLASDRNGGIFVLGSGDPIAGTGATSASQWLARFGYFDCFTDADGDSFGEDGDIVLSATACSNGLSFLDTDCDDTRVDVYPGAPELCDGVDNDCDGSLDEGFITNYCTSGTSTNGCVATMSSQGTPSRTAGSGFNLICSNVEGQRYGLILYGTNPGGALWAINGTSYICVAPPQGRTDSQTSGGTQGSCDGSLSIDFNLYLATHPNSVGAPYSAGQYLYAQGWYRDPAAPKGTNLSNGIQFALCN